MMFEMNRLYETSGEFFDLRGTAVMYMNTGAAQDVCSKALQHGLVVVRIEGGIWHSPGFEARIDCIWDGQTPIPVVEAAAMENNEAALNFVRNASSHHDAFVITAVPVRNSME